MTKKTALIATLVVVLLAAAAAASATLLTSSGNQPPAKQAVLDRLQQRRAAAAARSHAPKHPEEQARHSCPRAITPGIYPFRFGPFRGGRNLVNVASVVGPAGAAYQVYSGALDNDPQQGVLIVLSNIGDACAVAAGTKEPTLRTYPTPTRDGAVTIDRIEGTIVVYQTASGATGRFNVATGEYIR